MEFIAAGPLKIHAKAIQTYLAFCVINDFSISNQTRRAKV
jgi:hypothetical protein